MKKALSILVLALAAMTANAKYVAPTYSLTKADGAEAHGTIKFYVGETEVTSAEEGKTVTMTIAPDANWVVNTDKVAGQWIAIEARAPRRVDMAKDIALTYVSTDATTNAVTYTFTMIRANAEISCTYKKLLQDSWIQSIADVTYNGEEQMPAITVQDGSTVLEKDKDYTVTYSNNTAAALSTAANAPTVTITAVSTSEEYAGTASKTFTIKQAALTVKADDKSVTFGGEAPQYTATITGFVNNETKDVLGGELAFDCSYVQNQSGAGTYDITPSGLTSDNYAITFVDGTLTVGKKALENGMIAAIDDVIYTGQAFTPAPVVTFNGMTLVAGEDKDYTVSYENNTNVGTAKVTVTAVAGGNYSGSASTEFEIGKAALTITADDKEITFGDEAPDFTVSYDGFVNEETEAVLGGTLNLACSYVQNQSGKGTYDITPSGLTSGNYDITFEKGTLTVNARTLADATIAPINDLTYNGEEQEPELEVTFNGLTLAEGTDYTVNYADNTDVGTATVTIAAVANGNYSQSATTTFEIVKAALTVKADDKSIAFGEEAPEFTVSYEGFVNGETEDVLGGELAFDCSYVPNEGGESTYAITPKGLTSANYAITFADGTLTVGKKALENGMIAAIDAVTYNGEEQKPEPVVTYNGMTLKEGTDYTVSYSDNINAARSTATVAPTVTITAVEGSCYSGTASRTFTINMAPTKVTYNPWQFKKTYGDDDFTIVPETTGAENSSSTLSYSSNDESIATVDETSGLVHLVGTGVVRITATLSGDPNYHTSYDYYEVTVSPRVTEDGTITIEEGGDDNTTVTIDETGKQTGSTVPEGITVNTLNYKRELGPDDEAATTCLPYDPPTENLIYYTLTGAREGTLHFEEIEGTPKANTPYMVIATAQAALGQLGVKDVTMVKTVANSVAVDGYVFKGTFSGIGHDDAVGLYILQSGNRWGKVVAEKTAAYIPPFRAYVEATGSDAPDYLDNSIDNGLTGIQNIRTIDRNGVERWYDLNGHRIDKPATKGVYIKDGKKVVIK